MGSKWIRKVLFCIILHTRPMRSSQDLPDLPTLMILFRDNFSTFPLASPCRTIPGTLSCYTGCFWERAMRFWILHMFWVGLGLGRVLEPYLLPTEMMGRHGLISFFIFDFCVVSWCGDAQCSFEWWGGRLLLWWHSSFVIACAVTVVRVVWSHRHASLTCYQ